MKGNLIDIIRNFEVTKGILNDCYIPDMKFSLTRTYLKVCVRYEYEGSDFSENHRRYRYDELILIIHHNKNLIKLNGEKVNIQYDLYDFLPIANSQYTHFFGNVKDKEKMVSRFKSINREESINKILGD